MNTVDPESKPSAAAGASKAPEPLRRAFDLCVRKTRRNIREFADSPGTWSSAVDGRYESFDEDFFAISNWTSSFFTGMALLAWQQTEDEYFLRQANRLAPLYREKVFQRHADTMHDLGFLYSLYSVALYKLTGDRSHREAGLRAAELLAARFVPNGGYLRAWGRMDEFKTDYEGLAIIDCLMNLPLLFWAANETGNRRFRDVAVRHADTTLEYFVRADGSVFHAFRFDPQTGQPAGPDNYCGHALESHWARGTAWAIYGFALAGGYTQNADYAEASLRLARKFIAHLDVQIVPAWDFRLPPGEALMRDSSAAAVAACGFQEIQKMGAADGLIVKTKNALLEKLCSSQYLNQDDACRGVLRDGQVGLNGPGSAQNTYTSWGDYFLMEALARELFAVLLLSSNHAAAAPAVFVHPGGLNTDADFARMRAKVAANAQPWLSGWNKLTANSHAQLTWTPRPQGQIVRAGNSTLWTNNYSILYNDIAAAFQCGLRYQVSGDTNYADKAIQILNAWSGTLTNVTGDSDRYLAAGIYGCEFANAAEMMSRYSGWSDTGRTAFRTMMLNVFYPLNHEFLLYHNNACITHYWANWDLCNMASIISIAVLCDDPAKFDEAVNYFKEGIGNGSAGNAIYYIHPGDLGQLQESGRDQGHATLDIALLGPLCQVAWNQGADLYGYAGNRVLAGCEYTAKYNLSNAAPYVTYNNCDNANQTVISSSSRGTIRPCWEMIYNHYVNVMGLTAPYTAQFASLVRPEGGGGDYGPNSGGYDQLGFGTLTCTVDPGGVMPPAAPAAPGGLAATTASCGEVDVSWNAVTNAAGCDIMRSSISGGPYTTMIALNVTGTHFTDTSAVNGETYYYVVSALNAGGESPQSGEVSATATAGVLPSAWTNMDIGAAGLAGGANYCGGTFTLKGAGADIGGAADSFQFTFTRMTNNGVITAHWLSMQPGGTADKVGLVLRETTAAGSRAVALLYDTASGFKRVRMPNRPGAGASMSYPGPDGPTGTSAPLWLRLARTNGIFSGYISADGAAWTPVATATNSGLPGTLLAGLAVCSRKTNSLDISVFDNVSVSGVWPPVSLVPPQLALSLPGNQLQLAWPSDHTGWRLVAQSNLLDTNWFAIPGSTETNRIFLPVDPGSRGIFLRLVYP